MLYGSSNVYDIPEALKRFYATDTKVVDTNKYAVPISSVNFNFEMSFDVDKYLERLGKVPEFPKDKEDKMFLATIGTSKTNYTPSPSENTSTSNNGSASAATINLQEQIRKNSYSGDPMTNQISLNIVETSTSTPKELKGRMIAGIKDAVDAYIQILGGGDVNEYLKSASHTEFDRYFGAIYQGATSVYFEDARTRLRKDTTKNFDNIQNVTQRQQAKESQRIRNYAIQYIQGIFGDDYKAVKEALRNTSIKSMKALFEAEKIAESDYTGFVNAFSDPKAMTSSSYTQYYVLLRTTMVNTFTSTVTKNIPDKNIALFTVKTLVDMYIKTCYPMILFDFLQVVMEKYTKEGNFIGARHCLLAKIMYTYNFVNDLASPFGVTEIHSTVYQGIPDALAYYLRRNNRGIAYAGDDSTRELQTVEIVSELQKLSDETLMASYENNKLSKDISNNQLNVRTLKNTNSEIYKRYTGSRTQFMAAIFFTFVVVVAGTGLLFIKKEKWVYMGMGTIMTLIVLVYLLLWIRNMFATK
jgi:hypothetical protein